MTNSTGCYAYWSWCSPYARDAHDYAIVGCKGCGAKLSMKTYTKLYAHVFGVPYISWGLPDLPDRFSPHNKVKVFRDLLHIVTLLDPEGEKI